MQYTDDELALLEAIEEGHPEAIPFNNDSLKQAATETLDYLNEKKQISINLKRADLDYVKQRAKEIGISYQNIIQALVHNYRTHKLELKI